MNKKAIGIMLCLIFLMSNITVIASTESSVSSDSVTADNISPSPSMDTDDTDITTVNGGYCIISPSPADTSYIDIITIEGGYWITVTIQTTDINAQWYFKCDTSKRTYQYLLPPLKAGDKVKNRLLVISPYLGAVDFTLYVCKNSMDINKAVATKKGKVTLSYVTFY